MRLRIKVAKSARRHKVGIARIAAAMATEPVITRISGRDEPEYVWRAMVDGFMVEVVAVETTDDRNDEPIVLVLHAMPMYRE